MTYDYVSPLNAGDSVKVRTTAGLNIEAPIMGKMGTVVDFFCGIAVVNIDGVSVDFTREQLSLKGRAPKS
jgi:hypothetical protein